MNYQSLLELLTQEDAICRKLQVKINILSAIRQVEEEQKEVPTAQKARRADLQKRLTAEVMDLSRAVDPLRVAIGARIMELQNAAASVIQAELVRRESDGE